MKKLLMIFAFLLTAELCMAHKDSVTVHFPKNIVLQDTMDNDGWNSVTWSPEPLPEEVPKTKKEKKAEKKQARKEVRENSPSNFPRGVAWSSVALALIGLIKLAIQNCR